MKPVVPHIMAGALAGVFALSQSFAFQVTEQRGQVSTTADACETGSDGRAQLGLSEGGVLRVGADSRLEAVETDSQELVRGTVLFDFGKNRNAIVPHHSKTDVKVTGGSGFVRVTDDGNGGQVVLAGSLCGKVVVRAGGKSYRLEPGELALVDAEGKTATRHFNLSRLVESSSFVRDYTDRLPSEKAILREMTRYASLEKRGFIKSEGARNDSQLIAMAEANLTVGILYTPGRTASLSGPGAPGGGSIFTFETASATTAHFSMDEMRVGGTFANIVPVGIPTDPASVSSVSYGSSYSVSYGAISYAPGSPTIIVVPAFACPQTLIEVSLTVAAGSISSSIALPPTAIEAIPQMPALGLPVTAAMISSVSLGGSVSSTVTAPISLVPWSAQANGAVWETTRGSAIITSIPLSH